MKDLKWHQKKQRKYQLFAAHVMVSLTYVCHAFKLSIQSKLRKHVAGIFFSLFCFVSLFMFIGYAIYIALFEFAQVISGKF